MPGAGAADDAGRMTTTQPDHHEHDTSSLGAVVVSGLILLGLVVGASALVAQLVGLASWAMATR